jgi:hypothetical protein
VTICFSLKKTQFITTASDVLARNQTTKEIYAHKKFFINVKRNIVILISGSFFRDEKTPDPRKVFYEQLDEKINKRDSMLSVSKKILSLIHATYSNCPERIDLQLQICGFDGNTPHTYIVFTKNDSIQEHTATVTGTQRVVDYAKMNESKVRMHALISLIPNVEIVAENVRRFISHAIAYENDKAKENGEEPQTGGGINIVVVFPNEIAWLSPKIDSEDDPYKIS